MMERFQAWLKLPYRKKLRKLHAWNAWIVLSLAVTGVILYFPSLRGEIASFRVALKQVHIGLGIISIVIIVLYLPLLFKHLKQIKEKLNQQFNLGLVLFFLIGWSLTGIVLWLEKDLPKKSDQRRNEGMRSRLRNRLKSFGFMSLVFFIWLALSFNGVQAAADNSTVTKQQAFVSTYIALGDSAGGGFEPGMTPGSIPYGFAERLYEQMLYQGRAKMLNYGFDWLTSTGLRNFIEAVKEERQVTSKDIQADLLDPRVDEMVADIKKIKAEFSSANLITIMIGGNDFKSLVTEIAGKSDDEINAISVDILKVYADNLTSIVEMIHELNPEVKIVITDQYQPYPRLNEDLYNKLTMIKDALTDKLDEVVGALQLKQIEVQAAHVAELFVGKEFSYTNIAKMNLHPNQKGYAVIAKAIAETVWGEYKEPRFRQPISLIIGGKELDTPVKPTLMKGSTFVPLRYSEALGAEVKWVNETKTAIISYNNQTIHMTINSDIMRVGDHQKKIAHIPVLYKGSTYIPLRLMAEGLGFDVRYMEKSRTAFINP